MEAYRLCREKFSSNLSGIGAAIKGARWNSIGIEIIYTASNRSLASLSRFDLKYKCLDIFMLFFTALPF